jgi:hypothetical protein
MKTIVLCLLVLTLSSCGQLKESYQKGFDKGFMDSCIKSAMSKGADQARAQQYCDCTLKKVNQGKNPSEAAKSCL